MKQCALLGLQEVPARSRQPQTPRSDQPGLNRILMRTGSREGGRGGEGRGGGWTSGDAVVKGGRRRSWCEVGCAGRGRRMMKS